MAAERRGAARPAGPRGAERPGRKVVREAKDRALMGAVGFSLLKFVYFAKILGVGFETALRYWEAARPEHPLFRKASAFVASVIRGSAEKSWGEFFGKDRDFKRLSRLLEPKGIP